MLTSHVKLLNGETVLLRPLTPEDAKLYPDFLAKVTRFDLRLRFFSAMRELSPEMIDRLVHYDPRTAMAFIAIDSGGRMLGVVRLHDEDNHGGSDRAGEFAILLRSHLKGRGLGWLMMKHMIAYAREHGLKFVRGQVLADNTTMLRMCEELGFKSVPDPDEPGVFRVELPLANVPEEAFA